MLILISFALSACVEIELDLHMFSDIEECQKISSLKSETADIQIYDSPEKDKELKELQYSEYFGCNYKSDEMSFEIFAYEFDSNDVAMDYFKNLTGKGTDTNPTFLDSSGMNSFCRIIVDGDKAYSVYCTNSERDKVIDYINNCFSEDITEKFSSKTQESSEP